jgi:hypothetical protein
MLLDDMLNTNPLSVVEYLNRKLKESLLAESKYLQENKRSLLLAYLMVLRQHCSSETQAQLLKQFQIRAKSIPRCMFRFQNHLIPPLPLAEAPQGSPWSALSGGHHPFTCTLPGESTEPPCCRRSPRPARVGRLHVPRAAATCTQHPHSEAGCTLCGSFVAPGLRSASGHAAALLCEHAINALSSPAPWYPHMVVSPTTTYNRHGVLRQTRGSDLTALPSACEACRQTGDMIRFFESLHVDARPT